MQCEREVLVPYAGLAQIVLLVHLGFILFVVLGGLIVWRWPRIAWLHLPAVVWGVLVETMGWSCPLTPLENWLRLRAGQGGYQGDFVEQYLTPIVYPEGLTREIQIGLGVFVVLVNVLIYGVARARRSDDSER